MTKRRETLHTSHISLPPTVRPVVHSEFIDSHANDPKGYHVYLWASKHDHLPFYANVGTDFQAYEHVHKIKGGKWAVQQMYRSALKENFLCVFVERDRTEAYAYSLLHYIYNYFTKHPDPSNAEALFTMRDVEWIPEPCRKYEVVRPFPSIPTSTQDQINVRNWLKTDLRNRLLLQKTNSRAYDKYRQQKTEAIERINQQQGLDTLTPPVRH